MMDYAQWLQRAVDFTGKLRTLPGEMKVEINIAPPLSAKKFRKLAKSCRLPIPESLKRFWMTASSHCHGTYHWETPQRFHKQMAVAFPDWSLSHIWGGPEFDSASDCVVGNDFLSFQEAFRDVYPKDVRFYVNSIPMIPVGNGDSLGLYVRDNSEDPPVAFLCHDGDGASGIIASNLDEFLARWEELGYIGIHFLMSFVNKRTGLIDPAAFPEGLAAVRGLLRGEVHANLVRREAVMTERDWLSSDDPDAMLAWLEKKRKLNKRKLRLFCCACCRRVWAHIGEWGRRAVDVAERFADRRASRTELSAARAGLFGGERSSELEKDISVSATFFDEPGRSNRFMAALAESVQFSESEGLMHRAVYSAVDADTFISKIITCHLDEPELHLEKAAHADLIRHIFGSPFRRTRRPAIRQLHIARMAKRLYEGEGSANELRQALSDSGHHELADHFARPDHPKGCWALDLILGIVPGPRDASI